jgi:hypothetical protein
VTEDDRERERLRYIRESIARIGEYTRGGREQGPPTGAAGDDVRDARAVSA